jgi:hypothetical protein
MSRQARSKIKKQVFTFWSVSSLTVFSLLAGAVLQINAYIHQNSVADDYKDQIAQLSSQNDELEAQLSQSNSLAKFNEYETAQAGNYEKVDVASVRYIHVPDSQLAKN